MTIDYPAAHSMDTTWYAVDKAGHVGVFDTGEDGGVPEDAGPDIDYEELLEAGGDPEEALEGHEMAVAEALGPHQRSVFVFSYGEAMDDVDYDLLPFIGFYTRDQAPKKPLHVDQLPPAIREVLKQVRFETIDFNDAKNVQIMEHHRCYFWGEPPGYLASDGKTVRPSPGKEKEYRKLVCELRASNPELFERYVFEDADEAPRKKKASDKSKRKKDKE